jgi:hypothetical protein
MSECLQCEGYIEELQERIYDLECKITSLENENESEIIYNDLKMDWSVEL